MQWKFALLVVLAAPAAHAEPWLCTDADGNKAYSYEPESAKKKNCVHKPIPSANVWRKTPPPGSDAEERNPHFPGVDARMQKQRDADRRKILERELAEEKKALADAMKQLEEQQKRGKNRTEARLDDTLKPYHDRVRLHLTNISNLEKELGQKG